MARTPIILQSENSECGLACLAMIACAYGHQLTLFQLRQHCRSVSSRGISAAQLLKLADDIGLAGRAVRCEPDALTRVQLPAIVHWNLNHFVVLARRKKNAWVLHDPANGMRTVSDAQLSAQFTGIALEFKRAANFEPIVGETKYRLTELMKSSAFRLLDAGKLLGLSVFAEGLAVASPLLLQTVVDSIVVTRNSEILFTLAIGFALLVCSQLIVGAARSLMLLRLTASTSVNLSSHLMDVLLRLPLPFFRQRGMGDIRSRFWSLDALQKAISAASFETLVDGIFMVVVLAVLYAYSAILATISVVILLVYVGVRLLTERPLRAATQDSMVARGRLEYAYHEMVRGIETIKAFGMERRRERSFLNLTVNRVNADTRIQQSLLSAKLAAQALAGAELVVVVLYAAHLVGAGKMTVGMLFAYIALRQMLFQRAIAFIDKWLDFRLLGVHVANVSEILSAAPPHLAASRGHAAIPSQSASPIVEAVEVSFRFSPQDPVLFENFSMHVRPGETVALLGPSGSGKSTLGKLLAGLETPTSGIVRLQSVRIDHVPSSDRARRIGVVGQDDLLFLGTVAENISCFDPAPDWDRLREAAIAAQVHSEIEALPLGYHTYIADSIGGLSGGQRQRLMIARVFYGSPLLAILDESTSNIDESYEANILRAFKERGIAVLLMTHRLPGAYVDRTISVRGARFGIKAAHGEAEA